MQFCIFSHSLSSTHFSLGMLSTVRKYKTKLNNEIRKAKPSIKISVHKLKMQNAYFIQLHLLLVPLLVFPSLFFSLLFHSFTPQLFSIPLLLAHQQTLFSTPFILIPLLLHSFLLFLLYILSAFFSSSLFVVTTQGCKQRCFNLANRSITLSGFMPCRFFFSIDMIARSLSLSCPIVLLSHVCSRRKALKERSQLQLDTGMVRATCKTAFSVGNMSASSI